MEIDIISKREIYCKKKCGELKIHGAEYIDPLPNESLEYTKARQVKIYANRLTRLKHVYERLKQHLLKRIPSELKIQ